ncbi:MAG: AI-2E family transporter [Methanocalculus sp. MSAO_Arc1]|uniref:AI-2E family transporter n=1 Tax=Methanocalculus TaxID=71151 RepID=UPI000FEFDA39|nr:MULTISPECIES: AI-2E family transporter [unclassified Methanocalculus]MCP1661463.1 putative PurR-regulated permease PerM [Methanocalculus sp. AMF5]RQD79741.1 MAG: AI-2E family transporter [Methanocalculus sp. MSAO_Arc1]
MGFQWGSIDRVSLFVVALIALITFLAFFPLVKVVVFALSLAVVLIPAQEYLSRRITPALSAFFLTSGVVLLGFSAVVFTFSVLYDNMDYLIGIISSILEGLQPSLMAELPVEIDTLGLDDMINNLLLSIQDAIYVYLSMIPGAAVQLLLFILSLSILIYSGPGIKADVNRMIPAASRDNILVIWQRVYDTLYSIYVVHVSIAILTFILAIPFFWILGFEHIFFYSVLCGLFALIPFLGPVFILGFLAVYALSIGDFRALLLIIFVGYPVLCVFTDIYLRPVLMGKRVEIHPVIIFIGFFGGMAVMGIVGFILGPLLLSLMIGGYQIAVQEIGRASGADD